MDSALLLDGLIAAGLGLGVGLEREHSQRPDGEEHDFPLGARTFTLIALLGWGTTATGFVWLTAAAMLVLGGVVGFSFMRSPAEARGLTTEVAAMVTLVAGALVTTSREAAAALALVTALLLVSKPFFQRTVPKLRRIELTATIQLLIVLAILIPLLPEEKVDPWGVISPRKIGLFIALIAGISFVGYVAARLVGPSRGAGVSGIVGGLASSTAVTAAMAQQARRSDAMIAPGQLATFLANTVMAVRVIIVTAIAAPAVARELALPLGVMAAVLLGGAAWKYPQSHKSEVKREEVPLQNPFALIPALKWGFVLCVVLLGSYFLQRWLGARGAILAAAASGVADVDAITLSMSKQAKDQTITTNLAVLAITVAVLSNMVVKGGIAVFSGGWKFGRAVVVVFGIASAAAVVIAALSLM